MRAEPLHVRFHKANILTNVSTRTLEVGRNVPDGVAVTGVEDPPRQPSRAGTTARVRREMQTSFPASSAIRMDQTCEVRPSASGLATP